MIAVSLNYPCKRPIPVFSPLQYIDLIDLFGMLRKVLLGIGDRHKLGAVAPSMVFDK